MSGQGEPPRGRPEKFTWQKGDFDVIADPWTLTYERQVDDWRVTSLVRTADELILALHQRDPAADPIAALSDFLEDDPMARHMPAKLRDDLRRHGFVVPAAQEGS